MSCSPVLPLHGMGPISCPEFTSVKKGVDNTFVIIKRVSLVLKNGIIFSKKKIISTLHAKLKTKKMLEKEKDDRVGPHRNEPARAGILHYRTTISKRSASDR